MDFYHISPGRRILLVNVLKVPLGFCGQRIRRLAVLVSCILCIILSICLLSLFRPPQGTDESNLRHRLRNRDNLKFIQIKPQQVNFIDMHHKKLCNAIFWADLSSIQIFLLQCAFDYIMKCFAE